MLSKAKQICRLHVCWINLSIMDTKRKEGRYSRIFKQIQELLTATENVEARMSTVIAALHHKMDYYFWTGFYCLDGDVLTVRTYQGPLACQVLKNDTGVCWTSIKQQKTILVPDVHEFPGHIACDSRSNSEIVTPIKDKDGQIFGVLDVDSKDLNSFDTMDAKWLQKIVGLI